MATVYRASRSRRARGGGEGRQPQADDQNALRERFQREAQVISRLNHPNIVTMFDFGVEEDGTLFMVQELLTGKVLSDVIKETGALGYERTVRIMMQVLAPRRGALQELVHRDVKPENIFLTHTAWGGDQ